MDKLREAIEKVRSLALGWDEDAEPVKALRELIELATSILNAGMPEKAFIDYPNTPEGNQARHENQLYNKGIDDCLAYLTNRELKHKEFLQEICEVLELRP